MLNLKKRSNYLRLLVIVFLLFFSTSANAGQCSYYCDRDGACFSSCMGTGRIGENIPVSNNPITLTLPSGQNLRFGSLEAAQSFAAQYTMEHNQTILSPISAFPSTRPISKRKGKYLDRQHDSEQLTKKHINAYEERRNKLRAIGIEVVKHPLISLKKASVTLLAEFLEGVAWDLGATDKESATVRKDVYKFFESNPDSSISEFISSGEGSTILMMAGGAKSVVQSLEKKGFKELEKYAGNQLRKTIKRADKKIGLKLVTKVDEAFFWSGRTQGVGGDEAAKKIAESYGGTTLEKIIKDKGINIPEFDQNNPISVKAWEDASREYAQSASGTVRAVVGESLRTGNKWQTIELPALMQNPKVTKLITIDPITKVEKVIFTKK